MSAFRKAMICIAGLALLAVVCHAAIGARPDDVLAMSQANAVDASDDTASIPDFDDDGTIGFGDFVKFAGKFGLSDGDDGYDALYDLNDDGEIGFSDFVIFAQNFGKEAPSPVVSITDANLRAAIEAALGKASGAPITRAEMATLVRLFMNYGPDVSDLTGLEYAANLTVLHLGDNSISDLSPLAGLTKLENLRLSVSTSLRVLPPGVFARLRNLRRLVLGYTQIETLPVDAFSGLSSLVGLSLYSNRSLTSLPAGVFDGLTNLQFLTLDNNRLASLPVGLFSDLAKLEQLLIRGNELTSLPAGLLSGLVNLEELRLKSNLLTGLPAGVFSDLQSLESLSLGDNQLSELPDGLFIGLNSLKSLDLTWNPGAPFPLNVELKRTDKSSTLAPGPAKIEVGLTPGVPFDVDVSLMVHNGTASSASLKIEAGSASVTASVTASVGAAGATVINLGPMPRVPGGFTGIDLRAGAPLVLFSESDNRQPADRKTIPFHVLQVGDRRPYLDLGDYFWDEDGDELSYSVLSNDTSIVQARFDDGLMSMIPNGAGEISVDVTATDPKGFSVSQRMFVTVLPPPDSGSFDIDLVFGSPVSRETRMAAQDQVERWTRVIRGDLPDVPISGDFVDCGSWVEGYQFFGKVDDLVVFFEVGAIRGGKGLARTCGLRDGSSLPYTAHVFIGAECAFSDYCLREVFGHELGHALGFGTVWDKLGFLQGSGGDDPHFNGPLAIQAFDAAGGANYTRGKVPVSDDLGHWNGDVFGWGVYHRELMMDGGGTVLSAITVQSLADLGYAVDVAAADPFRLPQAGQAAAGATARLHRNILEDHGAVGGRREPVVDERFRRLGR